VGAADCGLVAIRHQNHIKGPDIPPGFRLVAHSAVALRGVSLWRFAVSAFVFCLWLDIQLEAI
jgi:hypothetical protein